MKVPLVVSILASTSEAAVSGTRNRCARVYQSKRTWKCGFLNLDTCSESSTSTKSIYEGTTTINLYESSSFKIKDGESECTTKIYNQDHSNDLIYTYTSTSLKSIGIEGSTDYNRDPIKFVCTCDFWSSWSSWSGCSRTCGGGSSTRSRSCPNDQYCAGSSSDSRSCNNQNCPKWTSWSNWSTCTKDCGTGSTGRSRSCQYGTNSQCPGGSGQAAATKSCNTKACPTWNQWTEWGECSEPCDGGLSVRNRTCSDAGLCGEINTIKPSTPDQRGEDRPCNDTPDEYCTPCPNTECWEYDAAAQTCVLIPGKCASLACDPTELTVKLAPGVFGRKPNEVTDAIGALNLTQTSVDINNTTYADGLTRTCGLGGDCGLSYEIVNETLAFTYQLSAANHPEMLSLSNVTELQMSKSTGADLTFICNYGLDINVTSTNYTIQDVQISGTQSATGLLDEGFSLALGASNVILGEIQNVTISWEIQGLNDIRFYIQRCEVAHDTTNVSLFKDGCMASVFVEDGSYSANTTEISYSYRTFKVKGADALSNQLIKCYLKICMNDCQQPAQDSDCEQNTPYKFKALA